MTLAKVEAGGGHQHRRDRLVAAAQSDEAVEALGEHDGLHRVGDHLATDQRGAHALVAHRDAVRHGDRAELHREPTGLADAALTCSASVRKVRLHGVISFHDEATPTCGFSQSSSVIPTARNMAREGALRIPSVTSRERGLMSTGRPSEIVMSRHSTGSVFRQAGAAGTSRAPRSGPRVCHPGPTD